MACSAPCLLACSEVPDPTAIFTAMPATMAYTTPRATNPRRAVRSIHLLLDARRVVAMACSVFVAMVITDTSSPAGPRSNGAQCDLRLHEVHTEGLGHGGVGDMAAQRVATVGQRGVGPHRRSRSLPGELEDVRKGGVGEGVRGRVGYGARHVSEGVVQDAVLDVHRIVVGGLVSGLDAATLIDGDVYHHRPRLHARHHVGRHHHWSAPA